jgi:hypothetical protein
MAKPVPFEGGDSSEDSTAEQTEFFMPMQPQPKKAPRPLLPAQPSEPPSDDQRKRAAQADQESEVPVAKVPRIVLRQEYLLYENMKKREANEERGQAATRPRPPPEPAVPPRAVAHEPVGRPVKQERDTWSPHVEAEQEDGLEVDEAAQADDEPAAVQAATASSSSSSASMPPWTLSRTIEIFAGMQELLMRQDSIE